MEISTSNAHVLCDKLIQSLAATELHNYLDYLKEQHQETYEHCIRVCRLSLDLGLTNDVDGNDLEILGLASLFHDLGKMEIPESILKKNGTLDSRELRIMQGHVRLGYIQVSNIHSGIVGDVVAMHHEFKTEPYPRQGNDRRQQPRETAERRAEKNRLQKLGQILAIADMVDALIHPRSYRDALTIDEAEQILRNEFTGDTRLIDQVLHRLSTSDSQKHS
ncbi:HD domain-containing protein [bacterium]|nr:HD domain-containing protein [candidate division CSSED10-310 bacterium]